MFSKFISVVAVFFICCSLWFSNAWVMRANYYHKDYPGKCFVNETIILSAGQNWSKSSDLCADIRCEGENGDAQLLGCGSIAPPENCRWDGYEDVALTYPLCCVENFVCDNEADMPNAKKLQEHIRDMFKKQLEEKQTEN